MHPTIMIYDISPPLSVELAVWPGDTPLKRTIVTDAATGDTTTSSALSTTVHIGAHADAPSHIDKHGAAINACPIERYLGPCQVIRVTGAPGAALPAEVLPAELEAPRVLLATGSYQDSTRFDEQFCGCSCALVDKLGAAGVKLLGIDTPSVDPFTETALPAHRRCVERDIAILEGLVLSEVPEGVYELIALPLRLVGFDASPVRAVLRELESDR